MIALPKKADIYIDLLMIIICSIFFFEILTSIFIQRYAYVKSMMFAFDVIATLTMGLDMAFVSDGVLARFEK